MMFCPAPGLIFIVEEGIGPSSSGSKPGILPLDDSTLLHIGYLLRLQTGHTRWCSVASAKVEAAICALLISRGASIR